MKRYQIGVLVLAVMVSGYLAHAQGPGLPGGPSGGYENPNPKGIPLPISPDAKFRPADPFAVPKPIPPTGYGQQAPPYYSPPGTMMPSPPGMMPYGYPRPGMMPNGSPMSMPGMYPGMYPGMSQFPPSPTPVPNGGQQFLPPVPRPNGGQPFVPPMPQPNGGQQFLPPTPTPVPKGEPYFVPREDEKLPQTLPPSASPIYPPTVAEPTQVISPATYVDEGIPYSPPEPYVLYEGGRSQKGHFECEAQGPYHCWAAGEYLYWWSRDTPIPAALATTAPAGAPALLGGLPPGAVGRSDTTTVLGGRGLNLPNRSGGRFTIGAWLDSEQFLGIEANYLIVGAAGRSQGASSDGAATSALLYVPYLDVNPATAGERAVLLSSGTGGAAVLTLSSQLQGAELNVLCHTVDWFGLNCSVIAGFRYASLWENLGYSTTQQGTIGGAAQFVNTQDQFKTSNTFFGGQLGLRADYQYRALFINSTLKLAYGSAAEVVNINGQTTTNTAVGFAGIVPTSTVAGGFFAQPTNIGRYSRNRDMWVPEATVNAGVQVWNWLRIYGGYNFLYLPNVLRPGDQIDRSVNSSALTSVTGTPTGPLAGPARPTFNFRESDFWIHGMTFGIEVRY